MSYRLLLYSGLIAGMCAFLAPAALAAPMPSSVPIDELSIVAAAQPTPADCLAAYDPMTPVLFENTEGVACAPKFVAEAGVCLTPVPLGAVITAVAHFAERCATKPPRGPD